MTSSPTDMARRRDGWEYLFHDYDLRAACDNRLEQMKAAINTADGDAIRTGDLDGLAAAYVEQFSLRAPELLEGAISVDVTEAQVDVSRDPMRHITDRSQPFCIPGISATYFVPFTGDYKMFKYKPSTFTMLIPAVTMLKPEELVFDIKRPDQNVAATKTAFEEDLKRVKEWLGWVRRDTDQFNASLPAPAQEALRARRARLAEMDKGVEGLGVPIRRASGGRGAPPPVSAPPPAPTKPVERYDVALSFAGEDRDYVERVAVGLKAKGVTVFYDKFETAELWGKNLVDHLAEIYRNRSRYVVMFVSKHYVEKPWTKHERQHAQARSLVGNEEYILPVRFDDTKVPGMADTVGYLSLKDRNPSDLVDLILKKLGSE